MGNCLGKRLPLKEPGKKSCRKPSGMNNTSYMTYSIGSAYVRKDKMVNGADFLTMYLDKYIGI